MDPSYNEDPYNRPWQGESRNSYSDLWIILPIAIIASIVAILLVIPVLVHRYCRESCEYGCCESYFSYFDTCVTSCSECGPGMFRPGRQKPRYEPEEEYYYEQNQPEQISEIPVQYTQNSGPLYQTQNDYQPQPPQGQPQHQQNSGQQFAPWTSATYQQARMSRTQFHAPETDAQGKPIRLDEIAMDYTEVKIQGPYGKHGQNPNYKQDVRQYTNFGQSAV